MLLCRGYYQGRRCNKLNRDSAQICSQCGGWLRDAIRLHNPGTVVRRWYSIESVIGCGSFGAVYKAVVVDRPKLQIALKETLRREAVPGFKKEYSVLKPLRHDNLPRYYDVFEYAGSAFLVMELIPGQSLYDLVEQRLHLVKERLVFYYADQLCDALTYLHSQEPSIIHRDIKPHNIRLTPEGLIKLVDFGLAKQGDGTRTKSYNEGWTPAYAPPEQIHGRGTDQRSDIYSFGATLYHLLTGQRPVPAFERENSPIEPLPSPRQLNPAISPALNSVVLTAMHMDSNQRFPTIEDMHVALDQARRVTSPIVTKRTTQLFNRVIGLECLAKVPAQSVINAVAWKPDGHSLASADNDGLVTIWHLNGSDSLKAEVRPPLFGGFGGVFGLAWSYDGHVLASSGVDPTIKLWDTTSYDQVGSYTGHTGKISTLAWSPKLAWIPDGKLLASGSTDGTVMLWRADDGHPVFTCTGHSQRIDVLAWSPNGQLLASGSADGTVRLWCTETGKSQRILQPGLHTITGVSWSPDGRFLASASSDGQVCLWDTRDGRLVETLGPRHKAISSLAWSAKDQLLVVADADMIVRFWRDCERVWLESPRRHTDRINSLAWQPRGQLFVTGSMDRTICLWKTVHE